MATDINVRMPDLWLQWNRILIMDLSIMRQDEIQGILVQVAWINVVDGACFIIRDHCEAAPEHPGHSHQAQVVSPSIFVQCSDVLVPSIYLGIEKID